MAGELRMLDSIHPENLSPGADAYLAYVDGRWPTILGVRARFPAARILSLAVFPADDADGLDIENGDATIPEVYDWFIRQQQRQVWRPVLYISAESAASLLATMAANGFARDSFRLLSAHYGAGEHICGPPACAYPQADGTQWTDQAPGMGGSLIDASLLAPGFFGAPAPTPQEDILFVIPELAATPGAPAPLAIPDGTTRLRFYTNDTATLRVSFPHVQPDATLTLTYGVPQSVPLGGAECVEVYRTDTGTSRVSCAGY